MEIYSWILQNKEIIKIIYALIIVLICAVIVLKSHRMFKLSLYQGIRYFRNAFLFYGIAFAIRYFLGAYLLFSFKNYYFLIEHVFSFFFIMAGFFLLYSLLWKKIESSYQDNSSLFNSRILLFYLMTLVLVILDYLWGNLYLLFYSQVFVFIFAFAISFSNYKSKGRNRKFLKFYALAMLLFFIAWTLNAFIETVFHWNPKVTIIIYLLNIFIFLLFLFGIIRLTKK